MVKDYKNYDYFSASIKSDNEKEMVRGYGAFGWEVAERGEDKRFSDYVTYTFRRPHKIANKDRLQFLQVGMEKSINLLAKLKKRRHSVSAVSGAVFMVFTCMLFVGGIVLACVMYNHIFIAIGVTMTVFGAAAIILSVFWVIKRAQIENLRYIVIMKQSETEVKRAVAEAATLSGVVK